MNAREIILRPPLALRETFISLSSSRRFKEGLSVVPGLAAACWLWNQPPVGAMDARGMHFLATMLEAITFWVLDITEEYVVGLVLLLAWAVLDIAPAKLILVGFSEDSWFFTIAALGMGVAVGQTSLLRRFALC